MKKSTMIEIAGNVSALKVNFPALASQFGRRGVDIVVACDLADALKKQYSGGFDLDCLDAADFQIGNIFNAAQAAELVFLVATFSVSDLEKLGHLMVYGF